MTTARKFFSETISVTGAAAISLADLLKAAGWGFEPGADNAIGTTPSMDSFSAVQCFVVPQGETLYVGHDQYVRDAAGVGPPRVYQGVPAPSGETYNVLQPERGVIDAHAIWFYSANTQDVSLVFVGF